MTRATASPPPPSTLLIDWGGVLTTSIYDSFGAFAVTEGLAADAVARALREQPAAFALLAELECGRLPPDEFERRMCDVLGLPRERADGLIDRMLGAVEVDEPMLSHVRRLRRAGVRAALVSNSWTRDHYDERILGRDFDLVVLSSEVGARKPEPQIYEIVLKRLAVTPSDCVFVDDLGANLRYPRRIGMATVRHEREQTTRAELDDLFCIADATTGR